MFNIECENCGNNMTIDLDINIDEYLKEGVDFRLDKDGNVPDIDVPAYIVYYCPLCESKFKYTYEEWEKAFRQKIAKEVLEIRKKKMFKEKINPYTINPDNGIEYCGQCSGYFGDGTCFVDIIKQCTIRKVGGKK